ncbi:hypothetical protein Hamer_G007988 [Homarus americanus]|uniref:Uncharacterized protein n=1 Tax=Homarus americanus TaxID=6706 RepID=A0A8J5JVI6_HOMAM|nr:hypothetical protein Hamer_G007988 [Homarus americanus]
MINIDAADQAPGEQYLVEPLRPGWAAVVPARCCVTGSTSGDVFLRVANSTSTQELLHEREILGVLEPG